ncbi:hypothetical protein U3516DRAFT_824067 [Neocallimastix sp. 'constans']
MLFNSVGDYNDENKHMAYEINIQKESPNFSIGNNLTELLGDLDFDMQNKQNSHLNGLNNTLNFDLSLSNNKFEEISSLKFEADTNFDNSLININPFTTNSPKKYIPNSNYLNIQENPAYILDNINKNENKILITDSDSNDNENLIINKNVNSITNINVNVSNINVNSNMNVNDISKITSNNQDTLNFNNLTKTASTVKLDYNTSSLSENIIKCSNQFTNSLEKYDNYMIDSNNKNFNNVQKGFMLNSVENYDHFSEIQSKPASSSNSTTITTTTIINDNKKNNFLNNNMELLPDIHIENSLFLGNYNKIHYQSINEIQPLKKELGNNLLLGKSELKNHLEKGINENQNPYENTIYSTKEREKEKEMEYQIQIQNIQKEKEKEKEILCQKYNNGLITKENLYNNDIKVINNNLQKYKIELENLRKKFNLQKEENDNLKLKFQDQVKEILNLKTSIKNYSLESRKYSDELQKKENIITKLNNEIKKQESRNSQINDVLQKEQKDNTLLNNAVKKQQNELNNLNKLINSKNSEIEILVRTNQQQTKEINQLNSVIQKQKDELTELKNVIQLRNNDIKQFNHQIELYQKQKKDVELKIKEQLVQTKQLEKINQNQNEEINRIREQYQKQKQSFEKLNYKYQNQKTEQNSLTEKYNTVKEKNRQLETIVGKLKLKIESQKMKPLFNDFNQPFNTIFEKSNPDLLNPDQKKIEINPQDVNKCIYSIYQKRNYEIDIFKKDISIFESLITKKNFNEYIHHKLMKIKNAYQEEIKNCKERCQYEIQAITETLSSEIKSLNQQLKKCQEMITMNSLVTSTREIIQMYPVESNEWIKHDRYLTEKMVRKRVKNEVNHKIKQLQGRFETEKCKLNSYYSMEYNRLTTEIKSKCYRAVIRLKSQFEYKMNQIKNLNKSNKSISLNTFDSILSSQPQPQQNKFQTHSTNKTKVNPSMSSTILSLNSSSNPYIMDLLKPISTSISPPSSIFTCTNKSSSGMEDLTDFQSISTSHPTILNNSTLKSNPITNSSSIKENIKNYNVSSKECTLNESPKLNISSKIPSISSSTEKIESYKDVLAKVNNGKNITSPLNNNNNIR